MPDLFSTIQSFENAFEEYYPGLVAFAHKQISNLDVSEDIVQELFIYLYENRDRIEIKESFKGYLFRAVFNRCKSFQRKQLTREKYEAELKKEDQSEYHDLLTETEFEEQVYQEINKLPERCREIFTMNRFEDLSNDEIAKKLGISKRTVETQISKALKILRSSLDPKTFFIFFL